MILVLVAGAWILMHPTSRALARWPRSRSVLTVPVEGVRRESIRSSWHEPRSGHRRHEGVDIFARRGTRVVAASDGEVVRIGTNHLGGNVVWIAGDGMRLYYYAHLSGWASGLSEGEVVRAGQVLGYVGTTGNAAGTSPHLHFGVYPASNGLRAVDPAPLLSARK